MPRTRSKCLAPLRPGLKLPALSLLFAAALSLALVLLPPGARAATTWHVSPGVAGACTQADPNCGTIQAAVSAASAGDTIQVAAGTYAEHVSINKDLTVNGAGAAQTVVDGTQSGTVFTISSGTVSLSGMTVTNGKSPSGGGITNQGTLTITHCIISGNTAGGTGGGIFNSAGATLTLTNSTVSNNSTVTSANSAGGGVCNKGSMNVTGSTFSSNSSVFAGGGISNGVGTLTISDSTISNNSASFYGGGLYNNFGTMNVTNVTVRNNSGGYSGGGIYNFGNGNTLNLTGSTITGNTSGEGGGIYNDGQIASITGSTISGNSAPAGGGIYNLFVLAVTNSTVSDNSSSSGGGIYNANTLTVTNSTVSGNSAGSLGGGVQNNGTLNITDCTISNNPGGGISNNSSSTLNITGCTVSNNSGGGMFNNNGRANVRSTIVAGNSADLAGRFTSQGHNLIGTSDSNSGFTNGTNNDIVGTNGPVDPQLLPLADNGGPTKTQLPRPSSPAVDAGDDAVLNPPLNLTTDQRGRPRLIGSHVDIGAVELNANFPGGVFQFSAATYDAGEGDGRATITVTRTGDTSGTSTVDVRTLDDTRAIRCDDTTTAPGVAFARCDYTTTVTTLIFAPGETLKTFSVPLIDDSFVEPDENVHLSLSTPVNASLGSQGAALLVIHDNDSPGQTNPIFNTAFFVRQQYLDFLSREPEVGEPWSATINNCAVNDPSCDRISVSANFFRSQEFQLKGLFVFHFYKVALGRMPLYSEIVSDMSSVTGSTTAELIAKKGAYTSAFAQRQEFKITYDAMTDQQFVDALMNRYNLQQVTTINPSSPDDTTAARVTLTRADLVNRLMAGTLTRAQVVRAIADSGEVGAAEYNPAFVAMQYFGYLRRDPDQGGYDAWVRTININQNDFRSMVNGFINSTEYRLRFGQP